MPPQRTMPPAKALKTERTHEENQERAYIAASRRSDRSLEARVESARRASEIHKRRTGRSLRVTEQDVVNEEMYEEEDDDLPIQYRRLTAHLQTQSPDFNRRLAAYLTNHVAMRSALEDSITSSYAQQYPNAPQFAHNHSVFQSPLHQQSPLQSPHSAQHRASPYPLPGSLNFRGGAASTAGGHGRSASIASPRELEGQSKSAASATSPTQLEASRRMSTPASQATTMNPTLQQGQDQQNMLQQPNFFPFSTALPMESQMFLGSALDPNDPMTSMLMAGSDIMPQFNPNSTTSSNITTDKLRSLQTPFDGMSSTLAPSALEKYPNEYSPTSSDGPLSFDAFHASSSFKEFKSDSRSLSREASGFGTDSLTSNTLDGDWSAFIDDASWDQTSA